MATTYGVDSSVLFGTEQDVDLTFNLFSDPYQVLLEDVYKSVTCPSGGCFWNPNTLDLRDYLRDSFSVTDQAALKNRIESLFEDDLRMTVSSTVNRQADGNLVCELLILPSSNPTPLQMVLVTDSNQVQILRMS